MDDAIHQQRKAKIQLLITFDDCKSLDTITTMKLQRKRDAIKLKQYKDHQKHYTQEKLKCATHEYYKVEHYKHQIEDITAGLAFPLPKGSTCRFCRQGKKFLETLLFHKHSTDINVVREGRKAGEQWRKDGCLACPYCCSVLNELYRIWEDKMVNYGIDVQDELSQPGGGNPVAIVKLQTKEELARDRHWFYWDMTLKLSKVLMLPVNPRRHLLQRV